jgi:hypothetical protein
MDLLLYILRRFWWMRFRVCEVVYTNCVYCQCALRNYMSILACFTQFVKIQVTNFSNQRRGISPCMKSRLSLYSCRDDFCDIFPWVLWCHLIICVSRITEGEI